MASLILSVVLLAPGGSARADVFVYRDADGVVNYTNAPEHDRYQRLSALMEQEGRANRAGAPVIQGSAAAYAPLVEEMAAEAGVDAALVHAVITAESGYNHKAVSRTGAQGLMQLMPGTAKRYAVKDAFDPRENIRGGTLYLRDLLQMFGGDLRLAVAAYNAGEQAVMRYGRTIPPYRETLAYVPKVIRLIARYKRAT
jgi:soluble lytic murein transglycosylase-like protein